ncbi:methyltransferase domain-containing protein [Candidatus Woesearchaeota archaeon]|nr:methyltransferase domain-containing protein [Candidatus Woesearchaeota archaeon]
MFLTKRYGGDLIHRQRDELGIIEVVDTAGIRSLHFGNKNRQSAFCLAEPEKVELSYIRAMLLNLVFMPQPERILILGLGGGSLVRFFLRHYPATEVVVVEYRRAVVDVARRFFGVPKSARLTFHVADCRDYIQQAVAEGTMPFDQLYIDAFDMEGLSPSINRPDFFEHCNRLLHPAGSLAINLWGHHRLSLNYSLHLLGSRFPDKSLYFRVPHKENVVGFGLGTALNRNAGRESETARGLQQRLALELPEVLPHCITIPATY